MVIGALHSKKKTIPYNFMCTQTRRTNTHKIDFPENISDFPIRTVVGCMDRLVWEHRPHSVKN